jgi:hypothetical protein
MKKRRQNILILYLHNSSLTSTVKAWACYNGADNKHHNTGDSDKAPYETGIEALRDGWRVIQFPQLIPPYPGAENSTSYFKNEFIFEQIKEING